mmetsp:Transcript_8108/g.17723  ORF Transcript_8108/g.17723 Transcript_8108/m.17723 type:complete len:91 (+) Transcript_8108:91-363(+)
MFSSSCHSRCSHWLPSPELSLPPPHCQLLQHPRALHARNRVMHEKGRHTLLHRTFVFFCTTSDARQPKLQRHVIPARDLTQRRAQCHLPP